MEKNKKTKTESLVVEEVKEETKVEEVKIEEPVVEETKVTDVETPQPIPVKKDKPLVKKDKNGEGAVNEVLLILFRVLLGIFVWLPAFVVLLVSLVALGIAIALVIMSLKYLGALIIVCGCLMFAMAFVMPLTKFVWRRDKK